MSFTADKRYGRRGGRWTEGERASVIPELNQIRLTAVRNGTWPEGMSGEDGWGLARSRELAAEAERLLAAGHRIGPMHRTAIEVTNADRAAKKAGRSKPRRRAA